MKISMNSKEENATNTTENQATILQNFAYALPKFPCYILITGPLGVMPGIYVKYFGLSLAAIGTAKLLSRVFDGITDVVIGYLSDHCQSHFGTRKPMIAIGAVLMLLAASMLYIPYGWEPQQTEPVSFAYLLLFYLLFTLAWTVFEVPHLAWGADISSDAKGRSQRFSFRSMMTYGAPFVFFLIPFLPIFDTSEVTPETLKAVVYLAWALMPFCLWVSMRYVPNAPKGVGQAVQSLESQLPVDSAAYALSKTQRFKQRLKKETSVIFANRPLLFFYATYTLTGLGYVMSYVLTYFYIDNYLGLVEKLPIVFLVHNGVAVCASWFWGVVTQKVGARLSWMMGMAMVVLGLSGIGLLERGEASFYLYLFCKALIGAGSISTYVGGYMILANIADYGKWKFDQECSGIYFAWRSTIVKLSGAVGVAIGLFLAEGLGFDAKAEAMTDTAVWALLLPYIGLPIILYILAIIVASRIPLSTQGHAAVRERLDVKALKTS